MALYLVPIRNNIVEVWIGNEISNENFTVKTPMCARVLGYKYLYRVQLPLGQMRKGNLYFKHLSL